MTRQSTAALATAATLVTAALAAPAGAARERARAWPVRVTGPGQGDLSLAQVRFEVTAARPRPRLRLRAVGPVGLEYVAAAIPRHQPRRRLVALVVVVNRRPSGSLAPDLAAVRLRALASRPLARPRRPEVVNALARPPRRRPAGMCELPASGALDGADVRAVLETGRPLPGFSAAQTVAQAWNVVCGRPADPAFRAAVRSASAPCPPCGGSAGSVPCPARAASGGPCPEAGARR